MGLQARAFVFGLLHLLGVGRHPQRAAVGESRAGRLGRHARRPGVPLRERGLAQRQFGGVVVHHHQVAHTGVGGAAQAGVKHQHALACMGQGMGAGRAHHTSADDDNVVSDHG